MNKQANREDDNQQPMIEDLPVNQDQAAEVQGGGQIFRNVNGTYTVLSSTAL